MNIGTLGNSTREEIQADSVYYFFCLITQIVAGDGAWFINFRNQDGELGGIQMSQETSFLDHLYAGVSKTHMVIELNWIQILDEAAEALPSAVAEDLGP